MTIQSNIKSNANESYGTKRSCPFCRIRFYDLERDINLCPGCNMELNLNSDRYMYGLFTNNERKKLGINKTLLEGSLVDDVKTNSEEEHDDHENHHEDYMHLDEIDDEIDDDLDNDDLIDDHDEHDHHDNL